MIRSGFPRSGIRCAVPKLWREGCSPGDLAGFLPFAVWHDMYLLIAVILVDVKFFQLITG